MNEGMVMKPERPGKAASGPKPSQCNCTALRKASRNLSLFYDNVLASCGLRTTQRSVLIHVQRAGAPTVGELAASLVIDRTGLSHTLKPLIRDGLLQLDADRGDKRSRRVTLTPLGEQKLEESLPHWRRAQELFEQRFGSERASELRKLLDEISELDFRDSCGLAGEGRREGR